MYSVIMNRQQQHQRAANIAAFLRSGGNAISAARKWNVSEATVRNAARAHGVKLVRRSEVVAEQNPPPGAERKETI